MSAAQPSVFTSLILVDPNSKKHDITGAVTRVSANFTIDAGTQIQVDVVDNELKFLRNGYFRLGQSYTWDDSPYTLTSVSVRQGEGNSGLISLEMLDAKFQALKGDTKPEVYRAANGFLYAQKVAKKYGLKFVGEQVKGKQQTIKVKSKNNSESVWSVLQRSANDNQFLCFIANKTLFFASPKYLIGNWGIDSISYKPTGMDLDKDFRYIPLVYPTPEKEKRFFLTEIPEMRKSIDSKKEAEGSARIFGVNARKLRAGMTVMVYGMSPQFNLPYLITSVDFEENSIEPVAINFATISRLAPEDKAKIDEKISEITVISGSGG